MGESKRTIYLDMDGVIADFDTAALRLFISAPKVIEHLIDTWPADTSVMKLLGISSTVFWKAINAEGIKFWEELPLYGWSIPLTNLVKSYGDVVLLSSPSRGGDSAAGKLRWIEQHLSLMDRDFILTPKHHKQRLARTGEILIDDYAKTCNEWQVAGGTPILFPRIYNGHPDFRDPLGFVKSQLELECNSG